MSAQGVLTAFDGAATPVVHTFAAVDAFRDAKTDELVAEWREQLASVPLYANARVRSSVRKSKAGVYRVALTVEIPVMESVSGVNASGYTAAPKVAYTNVAQCVMYAADRSTTVERRILRQLLVNLLGNISTTVTPLTTGMAPELFDTVFAPS